MTTNGLEPIMKMMVSHIEFEFFKADFSTSLLTLSLPLSPSSLLISLPLSYILARKKNQKIYILQYVYIFISQRGRNINDERD